MRCTAKRPSERSEQEKNNAVDVNEVTKRKAQNWSWRRKSLEMQNEKKKPRTTTKFAHDAMTMCKNFGSFVAAVVGWHTIREIIIAYTCYRTEDRRSHKIRTENKLAIFIFLIRLLSFVATRATKNFAGNLFGSHASRISTAVCHSLHFYFIFSSDLQTVNHYQVTERLLLLLLFMCVVAKSNRPKCERVSSAPRVCGVWSESTHRR